MGDGEYMDNPYTTCDEPIDDGTFDWADYCQRPAGHKGNCGILLTVEDKLRIQYDPESLDAR